MKLRPLSARSLRYLVLSAAVAQAAVGFVFHTDTSRAIHRTLGRLIVFVALFVQLPTGLAIIGWPEATVKAAATALFGSWAPQQGQGVTTHRRGELTPSRSGPALRRRAHAHPDRAERGRARLA